MDVQVRESELREFDMLKRNIEPMQERLEEMESNIKALLIGGAEVELGRFDASLVWKYMRKPAWKQILINERGQEFADECYRNTPGHTICELKVEEHAVLPLWNDEPDDEEDGE